MLLVVPSTQMHYLFQKFKCVLIKHYYTESRGLGTSTVCVGSSGKVGIPLIYFSKILRISEKPYGVAERHNLVKINVHVNRFTRLSYI